MAVIEQPRPVEVSELERLKIMALEWVNSVRGEYDAGPLEELPRGQPCDMWGCVVARALNPADGSTRVQNSGLWGRLWVVIAHDGRIQSHFVPEEIAPFIRLFDAREYPELIL